MSGQIRLTSGNQIALEARKIQGARYMPRYMRSTHISVDSTIAYMRESHANPPLFLGPLTLEATIFAELWSFFGKVGNLVHREWPEIRSLLEWMLQLSQYSHITKMAMDGAPTKYQTQDDVIEFIMELLEAHCYTSAALRRLRFPYEIDAILGFIGFENKLGGSYESPHFDIYRPCVKKMLDFMRQSMVRSVYFYLRGNEVASQALDMYEVDEADLFFLNAKTWKLFLEEMNLSEDFSTPEMKDLKEEVLYVCSMSSDGLNYFVHDDISYAITVALKVVRKFRKFAGEKDNSPVEARLICLLILVHGWKGWTAKMKAKSFERLLALLPDFPSGEGVMDLECRVVIEGERARISSLILEERKKLRDAVGAALLKYMKDMLKGRPVGKFVYPDVESSSLVSMLKEGLTWVWNTLRYPHGNSGNEENYLKHIDGGEEHKIALAALFGDDYEDEDDWEDVEDDEMDLEDVKDEEN